MNFLNVLMPFSIPFFFLCQGAARRLATQRKNLEVVESVGAAGKSDFNRSVKYFQQEVAKFDKCYSTNAIIRYSYCDVFFNNFHQATI